MSKTGPRIGSLVAWFGAKRVIAPEIVGVLGSHRTYWEPFAGSCAVILAKPRCTNETINDLHGDLVNLARCVRDEDLSARLDWKLRRTFVAQALFEDAKAAIRGTDPSPSDGPPDVDRACDYLVFSWMGMNGLVGTDWQNSTFARRFTSVGGAQATRFRAMVESLPWWHERLRHVTILSTCGIELCEKIEDELGTVLYVDPPYFKKGARYLHDFMAEDHERLAAALARFKRTRVVVSYYPHDEVDRLYAGWERVEVKVAKGLVNAGTRVEGRVEATEVLLVNGPAIVASEDDGPNLFTTEEAA